MLSFTHGKNPIKNNGSLLSQNWRISQVCSLTFGFMCISYTFVPQEEHVILAYFFGFMDKVEVIMENIGWWFKTTDQGMWQMPLQKAEETVCLGWLLYSADKYNREALCREIWQFTGVSVALRF